MRRNFLKRIRDAAARLHFKDSIGGELIEEIFRVLPLEEPPQ